MAVLSPPSWQDDNGNAAADGVMAAAAVADEVAEFMDTPEPGSSLFVQSTWSAGIPTQLPTGTNSVLCRLLACDGEQCWEGVLRRCDLSGALGDSWGKASNLRLLLDALAARGRTSASNGDVAAPPPSPHGEAVWSLLDIGAAPLDLTVRFVYREGPVVAVPRVTLQRANVSVGLSRFFALAHGAQMAAHACVNAAEVECAHLRERCELLQKQVDVHQQNVEAEEERLMVEFAAVLNAQKRRCRKLWEANRRAGAGDNPGAFPVMHATASLEECLDRQDPPDECDLLDGVGAGPGTVASAVSLAYPSMTLPPSVGAEDGGNDATFTIPLTLGMDDPDHAPRRRESSFTMPLTFAGSMSAPSAPSAGQGNMLLNLGPTGATSLAAVYKRQADTEGRPSALSRRRLH
mmetsp:Transcript_6410/g.9921  ORF Transcript_6410/g.9921 Transcript_6410/m.9921 type:complete len:405 (+) Transcript_6410:113-1327(+)